MVDDDAAKLQLCAAARSSADEEVEVDFDEDDGDEDAAYFAAAAQRPVKDWSNLSFSILRDCAVLQVIKTNVVTCGA